MKRILLTAALFLLPLLTSRADPSAIWAEKCAKCHGPDGKGDTKMGKKFNIKDFTDAKVQAGFTDEQALSAIKTGTKDDKGAMRMKAIEGLSDDDTKALVAYVRTLKK